MLSITSSPASSRSASNSKHHFLSCSLPSKAASRAHMVMSCTFKSQAVPVLGAGATEVQSSALWHRS
eukprot:1161404-Pelagomonas_calceolata.AAC.6